MSNIVKELNHLFAALPPDWQKIETILNSNPLSEAELAEIAYSIAENCFGEYQDVISICNNDASAVDSTKLHNSYLLQSLELLLQHGLNPNTETAAKDNVMFEVQYADYPNVGASALRLLLEHGGNPNLQISGEPESIFEDLDFEICYDENLYYPIYRTLVQCWLVLIAYGASLPDKNQSPIRMLNNNPVSIFKDFENYDYTIEMLPKRPGYFGCWIMHIFDTRTNEEVAIFK